MSFKDKARRVWHFLWEDNSPASWVANVVVSFILIKFVVYPLLSLLFSTSHPIVAVVSGSMEHNGQSFNDWWNDPNACCRGGACESRKDYYGALNISEEEFRSYRFRNGFNKGDLMVLFGSDTFKEGDVLVFGTATYAEPIIHRVVEKQTIGNDTMVSTKGDNNCVQSPFEKNISKERWIGKAVLRIPLLGWIKIGAVNLLLAIRGA